MRVAAGIFSLIFLISAAVQWNDPDPLRWIFAYLTAAALSAAAATGRVLPGPNTAAAVVFSVWFASLAPTIADADIEAFTSFEMTAVSHEEPREAVGLALCAGWSAVLAAVAWRAKRGNAID